MTKPVSSSRVPLPENQFKDDGSAGFYDEHSRRFMMPVYRRFAARAAGLLASGNHVLDIGTGNGLLAIELSKARPDRQITGIDISKEMLSLARQNIAKANLSDRIILRQAPAEQLPFPENSFDIVVSNASLHLWKDPVKVFSEIARVTAPGGWFLLWDNLRIPALYPLFNLTGRLMGMNRDQRILWLKAIQSSYTAGEAKALLKKSLLKDGRAVIHPRLLELEINWRKL